MGKEAALRTNSTTIWTNDKIPWSNRNRRFTIRPQTKTPPQPTLRGRGAGAGSGRQPPGYRAAPRSTVPASTGFRNLLRPVK